MFHPLPSSAPRAARFSMGLACLVALVALAPLGVGPAAAEVRWKNGPVETAVRMSADDLVDALGRLARPDAPRRVVLHFEGPVESARREALERSGVRLLAYLGDHAWFATLGATLDARAATTVGGLVRAEPVRAEWKLHPDLSRGLLRPWSVISPPPKPGSPEGPQDPIVAVYVLFHPDVDVAAEAVPTLARNEGRLISTLRSINAVVAHLPASRIGTLAAEDVVMYVEPPLPALSPINDSNRTRLGADVLQEVPYQLDGAGVTVLVYDGGQVFAHADLAGRLTIGASDTDVVSDHATHVAGTIGGDGASSGGQYRGMAPAVEIVSYSFEQEGGLSQGFLYTDPGDLEADYGEAIAQYGADLSNNSIGTNTASNGFPCEWEGNYGVTDVLIDSIARGSLGAPFRIVWANGNERGSGACGSSYVTTAPPACAKNHITVGAMHSNDDSVTWFTSWGPADDGRLKPDVSGPGCQSGGDGGVTSTSSGGGYNVKCGTSMASPSVAGVAALLLQQYRLSFPGEPDFRNATLKAILANTAQDIETVGPDFKTGYGSVRGVPAVDLIADGRFLEAEVAQGEVYSFIVVVAPGDPELKVTLAWDDAPGTPNVNPVLVNDLDLRVIDTSGATHHPWTLDPGNPSAPAVRIERDGTNNIEQVVIDAPAPGAYRVEVEGFDVAEGPVQSFGVAAAPSLINCAPSGVLVASPRRISCSAVLGLEVVDCDLNTDDGLVETVAVSVVSASEPGGETPTLTENAPESAAFEGSIPVATTDAPGVLLVAEGETITATYVDADDGGGGTNVPVVRQVAVDCTPPELTSVTFQEIEPREATVLIGLDEPARVSVRYGTNCASLSLSATRTGLITPQTVRLTGLADDTTYYFDITAEDEAGNDASFDNASACYTFTTPEVPDFFTEQFSSGIDLVGRMVTLTPNGSNDFYGVCVQPITGLPTDPTGGTDSGLGDDQPTSFTLGGGHTVSLYGQSYATVHVGPNGFLTFGSGDSTYTESMTSHFSLPRVAAAFDDLNPGAGGSVSWLELADRIAVTWLGVPEYGTSNSNTFQIEMFHDGVIRMTWVQLSTSDAIVGLSAGGGLSPDFFPTDLSAIGCGPHPPIVGPMSFHGDVGAPVAITLQSSDDGLPAPGHVTYRVTSLPVLGALSDGVSGAPIERVPHDLAGSALTYTPASGQQGTDAFEYRADDGGAPPEGGESAAAMIDITVGGEVAVYEFLVDNTQPAGWVPKGAWAFGQPTGAGSGAGDPAFGFTGSNVYGYNLAGDYPNNMGEFQLASSLMDMSHVTGTRLEFRRWLGVESGSQDHATVQIKTGATPWTMVWEHTGATIDEGAWSLQSYDLSALADGVPAMSLRWTMGPTNASVTYAGWNIDDIRIWGTVWAACSAPPDDVPRVRFDGDRQTLHWGLAPFHGGMAPVYDVLRSTSAGDFSQGICLGADEPDPAVFDAEVPDPGVVFHYLVRAQNECGTGGLGQTSSGAIRTGPECEAP